ncbi:UDP-phosphate galactose phosphotransferase [Clostridia bacterium]|nr:UDP-phosphate galactose phosphotransferase [Clostridia bacterium]
MGRRRILYAHMKRALDIVCAAVLLILLCPVFVIISVMICLDSPGPVFFLQRRVGRGGGLFRIYKFRTMYTFAPRSVATSELRNAGAVITPIGRTLRKSSIDELPQLINVLRGEMSLIGPRPLVPEEAVVHEARQILGAYNVRPGITGWAQVNGRDCVNAQTKAELDAYYAAHLSLRMDAKVILYSVMCVITARGIQEGGEVPNDSMEDAVERPKPRNRQNEWFARYDVESSRVYSRSAGRQPRAPGA